MSNYLTAYRERLERNQAALIQLVKDVHEKDNSIEAYVHHHGMIQGVVFIKGETINSIHFHEVPYRWSGCGYTEFGISHNGGDNISMPFTVEDVLMNFKPIKGLRKSQVEVFKNKEQYLKWCSYLEQLKITT